MPRLELVYFIILGALLIMTMAIVGIVFALHEELGRAGQGGPDPSTNPLNETETDSTSLNGLWGRVM